LNLPEINLFHFKFHRAKKEASEATAENCLGVRLIQNSPPTGDVMTRRMRYILAEEREEFIENVRRIVEASRQNLFGGNA
jgi:hypothetical protein